MKKILKVLSFLSLGLVISACNNNISSSTNINSNSSSSTRVESSLLSSSSSTEYSSIVTSSNTSKSSSTSSSVISNSTSSSITSSTSSSSSLSNSSQISEEEKYIADPAKRITINLDVNLPSFENEIYVIGDFNNWGKFNTLNDSSYQVIDGKISISNVENGETYSYMFVQKIIEATYTYNFDNSIVDSENNPVIGYTNEGKLISQYCIVQTDQKFSLVATDNSVFTNTVSNWTSPIYGDSISVPVYGYNLCVSPMSDPENTHYVPLESMNSQDGNGRIQYVAKEVTFAYGDAFTIYDGDYEVRWAETNLEQYGAGTNFVTNSEIGIVCVLEGTYNIYVKLKQGDNSIYIEKYGESSEGTMTTPPPTGYALLVTNNEGNKYYIPLVQVDEFDGFTQHFADNVSFSVGDTFVLYDCNNSASWVEDTLSPYGQYQKFEVTNEGIRCKESGVYDVYVKFKFEADEIYIGNQDGA